MDSLILFSEGSENVYLSVFVHGLFSLDYVFTYIYLMQLHEK